MQTRFSGFFSKFFFEILPATLASAAAGFLFAHFGMPPFQQAAQQAAVVSPANEELLKTVHDDHEAFVDFLKKANASRQEPSPAAQQAEARLKQEEQAAAAATRQAKEAEAKALAATRKAAARSAQQAQAAKVPAPAEAPLGQLVVNRPMTIAPAQQPSTLPALPTQTVQPAPEQRPVAPQPREAATSSGGWFSGGPPPRPPGTLPQQNFSTASDVIGPGG